MISNKSKILFIYLFLIVVSGYIYPYSTDQEIFLAKLNSLEGIRYNEIKHDSTYAFAYEIYFPQYLDHNNPSRKIFLQRLFLYHRNYEDPTVLITEGYNAVAGRHSELTSLLNSNEIIVEHRYFEKSCPDTLDWQYLTIEQAANDHHRIITFFKDLYRSKWISTGVSKGGQTAIFHKYFFPADVDVTVPYVAPLNLEQEDSRIYEFLNTVGTPEQRDRIKMFQRNVLRHRDKMIPLLEQYSIDKILSYIYDLNLILEYTVFEYSFSFWQWEHDINNIPDVNASAEDVFKHLVEVSSPSFFSKKEMEEYSSFMYQAYDEIGFYGYQTKDFSDLLVSVKTDIASNIIFAPEYERITFNQEIMKNIDKWLRVNGNNMLYIYGATDTWSAAAVNIGQSTNAVKMVKAGGSHLTRIKHFSDTEKEYIFSTLAKWLGIEMPAEKVF